MKAIYAKCFVIVLIIFLFLVKDIVAQSSTPSVAQCTYPEIIRQLEETAIPNSIFSCSTYNLFGAINDDYWNECYNRYFTTVQNRISNCNENELNLGNQELKRIFLQKAGDQFDSIAETPTTNALTPIPETTPTALGPLNDLDKSLEPINCNLAASGYRCCMPGSSNVVQVPGGGDFDQIPIWRDIQNFLTNMPFMQNLINNFGGNSLQQVMVGQQMNLCPKLEEGRKKARFAKNGQWLDTKYNFQEKEDIDAYNKELEEVRKAIVENPSAIADKIPGGYACYCDDPANPSVSLTATQNSKVAGVATSTGEVLNTSVSTMHGTIPQQIKEKCSSVTSLSQADASKCYDDVAKGVNEGPNKEACTKYYTCATSLYNIVSVRCNEATDVGPTLCIDESVEYCLKKNVAATDFSSCVLEIDDSLDTAATVCEPLKNKKDIPSKEYTSCYDCVLFEDGIWTSFGCIYADFSRTISERIFSLAISIAGLITFGCILYAAFLMQMSAGNPEKTKHAQELMTSCITGLIVIIFSVFILRVIGVDILRIPGFI